MNYKINHIANWLLFANDKKSVFRRTFRVFIFTVPGYLANLGLLYLAPRIVDKETFGIYYLSNTIINWLYAPAIIMSMFLLRDITNHQKNYGLKTLADTARKTIGLVSGWSLFVMLVFGIISLLFALLIGVKTLYLIPIIFIIVSLCYIGESIRIYFQATYNFLLLGSFNMSWMVSRLILGSLGLYVFQSAWGGLSGIALAPCIVFLFYYQKVIRPTKNQSVHTAKTEYKPHNPSGMLPGIISYSILMLVCNMDILVGYFVLDLKELGTYSASSILAKAMLLLAFPLSHSVYPALLSNNENADKNKDWIVFVKGMAVTFLISSSVVCALYFSSDLICSSYYGIKGCDKELYEILLIPPVFLFLLVFLSIHSFSTGHDYFPSWLAVSVVIFVTLSQKIANDMSTLGFLYIFVISASFFVYFVVTIFKKYKVKISI